LASEKCGELFDRWDRVVDGLRLRESSRAGLGGQLVPNEGQGVFGEIVRQVGRDAGHLGEVPAVSGQIVEADLQSVCAGGVTQGTPITPLEHLGTAEGALQCRRGLPVGPHRVVTEVI